MAYTVGADYHLGLLQVLQFFKVRIMDKVLHGLHHVVWYLDDILVSGENDEQHLSNLKEVLSRLEKYGLRVRLSKCQFFQDSVEYLGHEIYQEGIQPLEKKVPPLRQ